MCSDDENTLHLVKGTGQLSVTISNYPPEIGLQRRTHLAHIFGDCLSLGFYRCEESPGWRQLTKENTKCSLVYSFRGLGHCHHEGRHGGMQADMELEKDMRVLHFDLQASGDCVPHWK